MQKWLSLSITTLFLSGCSHAPTEMSSSLVAVPDIIGAMKCAFATAIVDEKDEKIFKYLEGNVVSGTLDLQVLYTKSNTISMDGELSTGPFVLPYATGMTNLSASFSRIGSETNTIKTQIKFRYYLWADNNDVCKRQNPHTVEKYGFSNWLGEVIAGMSKNSYEYPLGQTEAMTYETNFAVKKNYTYGGGIDIVLIKASAAQSTQREDIQGLKFTIQPISKDNPAPNIWSSTYKKNVRIYRGQKMNAHPPEILEGVNYPQKLSSNTTAKTPGAAAMPAAVEPVNATK